MNNYNHGDTFIVIDAMKTTNLPTTVIILCFLFGFSFLSWHCMEKVSMEMITAAK